MVLSNLSNVNSSVTPISTIDSSDSVTLAGCFIANRDYHVGIDHKHTMREFRVVASRVSNYIAYVEANDEQEAEALALQSDTDWQFLDDDADYQVYTVEEAE